MTTLATSTDTTALYELMMTCAPIFLFGAVNMVNYNFDREASDNIYLPLSPTDCMTNPSTERWGRAKNINFPGQVTYGHKLWFHIVWYCPQRRRAYRLEKNKCIGPTEKSLAPVSGQAGCTGTMVSPRSARRPGSKARTNPSLSKRAGKHRAFSLWEDELTR